MSVERLVVIHCDLGLRSVHPISKLILLGELDAVCFLSRFSVAQFLEIVHLIYYNFKIEVNLFD